MIFQPYGPLELSRDCAGLLLLDRDLRTAIWKRADQIDPGLSDACGCYVFAVRTGGGTKPWYVGKAVRQSFKRECLTQDKVTKYNSVLQTLERGTPLLYLYGRVKPGRTRFSAPSTTEHRDVPYLEKMLIALALGRNKDLVNKRETTLLRNMIVPGLLNSEPGRPASGQGWATAELGEVMGY